MAQSGEGVELGEAVARLVAAEGQRPALFPVLIHQHVSTYTTGATSTDQLPCSHVFRQDGLWLLCKQARPPLSSSLTQAGTWEPLGREEHTEHAHAASR